jgi:Lectin C-type domain
VPLASFAATSVWPMFLSRPCIALLVAPVTWLANGCFLGGDYFTEQESPAASSLNPSSEEFVGPTQDDASSATLSTSATSDPERPANWSDVQSQESSRSATSADETSSGEGRVPTTDPSHQSSAPESSSLTVSGPPTSDTLVPTSDTAPPTSEGERTEVTSGLNSSETAAFTDDEASCGGLGCQEPCAPDEHTGPGGRCYWFSAAPVSWDVARSTCTTRGTGWTLVTLRTEAEDDFVAGRLNSDTWIGAEYRAGSWRWVNDTATFPKNNPSPATSAGYANWGTNEPSGSRGENCARYHSYNDRWRWGDTECDEGRFGVACQGP